MAKITSKLQATLPKALALDLGLKPGDEIEIQIMRGSAPAVKHATLSVRSSRGHSD